MTVHLSPFLVGKYFFCACPNSSSGLCLTVLLFCGLGSPVPWPIPVYVPQFGLQPILLYWPVCLSIDLILWPGTPCPLAYPWFTLLAPAALGCLLVCLSVGLGSHSPTPICCQPYFVLSHSPWLFVCLLGWVWARTVPPLVAMFCVLRLRVWKH